MDAGGCPVFCDSMKMVDGRRDGSQCRWKNKNKYVWWKNKVYIWKNKEEKKFPIKMNFPPIACLYKTDASKKRGGRTLMKRIS